MINSAPPDDDPVTQHERVDSIVAAGPHGAVVVAGIATFIVVAMWMAFYLAVFLPRAATP